MTLPNQPVTLSIPEIDALNQRLSTMRHDINNHLSLLMAALELVRRKPDALERMSATLTDQPGKIATSMTAFSLEFEKSLGIKR
jgi:hypothetical protein